MAEKFNNYLVSIPFSSSNTVVTIIPHQGLELPISGDTVNSASGTRTSGATSQIHSIYLTKASQDTYDDTNPEANGVKLSIEVYDTTNSKGYYIAKYINVLPNSSFYIEKTITLRGQDSIRLKYHGTTAVTVDAVCSGVDLT